MVGSLPNENCPAEQVLVALVRENMYKSVMSVNGDRTDNFIVDLQISNMKLTVGIIKLIKI